MAKSFGRYCVLFEHMPAALVVGAVFCWHDPNLVYFVIALAFGWLIDADHMFDYLIWLRRSNTSPSLGTFLSGEYFHKSQKIYVPLHSIELTITLIMASFLYQDTWSLFMVAAIAHVLHLAQDQISNRPTIMGYFFIARMIRQFDQGWFCRPTTQYIG